MNKNRSVNSTDILKLSSQYRQLLNGSITLTFIHGIALFAVVAIPFPFDNITFCAMIILWFPISLYVLFKIGAIHETISTNLVLANLLAIVIFIPLICFVPIAITLVFARRTAIANGIQPFWFQFNQSDLLSYEGSTICFQCSYNLVGNQSGICPECGWRIQDA